MPKTDKTNKPTEAAPDAESDTAPVEAGAPPRPSKAEIEEHADQLAAIIGPGVTNAVAVGLASSWAGGYRPDELVIAHARIAQALHTELDAALRARGIVTPKD
jgi:hypothetical protein